MPFELDPRLARDTLPVARLGLCDLRFMNDRRWPWAILVPQREGLVEFHDMRALDQTMLTFESGLVSKALKEISGAAKMNVATIGNVVPMMHLHVVARREGDPNWPKPVWGFGTPEPYSEAEAQDFAARLRSAVLGS